MPDTYLVVLLVAVAMASGVAQVLRRGRRKEAVRDDVAEVLRAFQGKHGGELEHDGGDGWELKLQWEGREAGVSCRSEERTYPGSSRRTIHFYYAVHLRLLSPEWVGTVCVDKVRSSEFEPEPPGGIPEHFGDRLYVYGKPSPETVAVMSRPEVAEAFQELVWEAPVFTFRNGVFFLEREKGLKSPEELEALLEKLSGLAGLLEIEEKVGVEEGAEAGW